MTMPVLENKQLFRISTLYHDYTNKSQGQTHISIFLRFKTYTEVGK